MLGFTEVAKLIRKNAFFLSCEIYFFITWQVLLILLFNSEIRLLNVELMSSAFSRSCFQNFSFASRDCKAQLSPTRNCRTRVHS